MNVTLAFELMQDAGLARPKARPEDIVNLDLKSTLRVLYNLFTKYKHLNWRPKKNRGAKIELSNHLNNLFYSRIMCSILNFL